MRKLLSDLLDRAPLSVEGLAREAGLSGTSLWGWASGRRNPTPENLARLADVLDGRGDELKEIAAKLRRASQT